ncbi:MAG: hypothetical protein IPP72_18425 [Chitinophagaceae bacterium]|nr:hypothetical protein [Chitinophagaceae bacterium]
MKKKRLSLLPLLLLLAVSSCKKDDAPSNTNTSIPYLKIGNKWIYNITGGFTSYTTTTNEITAVNNGVYTLATKFDTDPGANAYLYGDNGYLNWYDEGQSKGANQKVLKYNNLNVGNTWTRITASETYTHECLSVNESVTVPAGTFICKKIKVTFANAFNEQTTYWSDDFGQVKVDNLFFSVELANKNF